MNQSESFVDVCHPWYNGQSNIDIKFLNYSGNVYFQQENAKWYLIYCTDSRKMKVRLQLILENYLILCLLMVLTDSVILVTPVYSIMCFGF